jgi:hypothetical protein
VFEFEQLIPVSLSTIELSYAQTAADFSTFSLNMKYNRFNIKRRAESTVATEK